MFKPNVPLYLRDLTFKTETVDQETRKIVVMAFMSQPFTKEMADELGIGRHLFSMETAEPLADVISCALSIDVPLQKMTLRMAPDQGEARIVIPDVAVKKSLSIRKDKEGPVLAANLDVSFRYPDAETLLYVANGVNNQHFVTFDQQQGNMLDEQAGKR